MVCPMDIKGINVSVRDSSTLQSNTRKKSCTVLLTPTKSIDSIFIDVSKEFDYCSDDIEIILHSGVGPEQHIYVLHNFKDKTVEEAGMWRPSHRMSMVVSQLKDKNMSLNVQDTGEDDLLLGASASPTTGEIPSSTSDTVSLMGRDYEVYDFFSGGGTSTAVVPVTNNYVGLVNQAMTCYLNSLLQALYMTPEFRNALYNWEFDGGVNESRSIPYQLQKLFLNLQTSSKTAVETTDLTTSFGWQGSDAWHQHDIQELCRVMFDALEQKFKDTKQANLINDLYEGKMLDYVKCLECTTEKSREDTFLDIPLPVRPFGSTVAYNSVVEALRAFVQPETLDGNNQYFCEKCNKKCDAHKGLKFTKFPYLLTLHLKRFDFDYSTLHRIKLNDKVVFPEILNLNSFISPARVETEPMEERENIVKCDECSTTDSGSADDESCQGTDVSSTVNGQDDNCADSDEGIDVSSGNNLNEAEGPYMYELFSIMIHSGSASGGHYYAYIKDFDRNMWYCFNDQSVSGITEEDIKKTYGGGPLRGYYSGVYSSSTNAYMLMYRQIDKNRNARAMTTDEFPPHIQKLLMDMQRKEEEDRKNREKANGTIKITIYCIHPTTGMLQDAKFAVFKDSTLEETAHDTYVRFKLESLVDFANCRLVLYNQKQECIDSSLDSNEVRFGDNINYTYAKWMLEIREPGTEWKKYKAGGVNMKVYSVNLETVDVDEPKIVRVDLEDTVKDLRSKLSDLLQLDDAKPRNDPSALKIVLVTCGDFKYLDNDSKLVPIDSVYNDHKLYVTSSLDDDSEKSFQEFKLKMVVEQLRHIVNLHVVLPETDVATLESLSIPSLDLNQNMEKIDLSGGDRGANSPNLRVSPQPYPGDGVSDQSNSEDSSLSDSDRTLVGEAPGDCIGLLSSSPNSPSDQHMASPSDPCEDNYNHDVLGHPGGGGGGGGIIGEEMNWDDVETGAFDSSHCSGVRYYFKVTSVLSDSSSVENNQVRCCKILADSRMSLEIFKKHLEGIVRVPSEYFKVFRQFPNSDEEWCCLTDTLSDASIKDGERIIVKLGRVLRKDEVKCNVYHLKPDCMDVNNLLFEHIIAKGSTVREVKRDILVQAKKQHMLDIPYNKCRLRERNWKKPKRVYLDDQRFDNDIIVTSNVELFLQELSEPEPVVSADQTVYFVRQWCPSTLTLKPFHEVVLTNTTMEELKQKISEKSNIPVENLDVASIKATIPCDMHLLVIYNETDWNLNVINLEQWPVSAHDGSVFYYRDSREPLKELTEEEKKEINQKENARLGKQSLKSYSPGRERALKIYVDPLPDKSEENSID